MPKFMEVDTALARLAEDEDAPVADRVRALKLLSHPPLCLLRRLLVDSDKPDAVIVPARVKSIAALRYAQEVSLRKIRPARPTYNRPRRPPEQPDDRPTDTTGNALGV